MVFYTEQGASGFLVVENIVAQCHCWIIAHVSRNYVIPYEYRGVVCFWARGLMVRILTQILKHKLV